nr:reverse transcriptase domain-containing protein [Tanacetum cinerariifolium]
FCMIADNHGKRLGNGFALHWIGNNIPNNQNGWIEEDTEEEEEDPKEDPEEYPEEEPKDNNDDMEVDDETEVIDPYMDDGSNNPPPPNSEDEETPPTSPVIPDADDTSTTRAETSRAISSTTTTETPEVIRQLDMLNKNFQEMMKQMKLVKSVDMKCETCGGPHSYTECPAIGGYTQEADYATTGLESCMALADLGASINLMPFFVWKKLSLPDLTSTRMTLELDTTSYAYLLGIAKDVFVQVGKFIFPADFIVIDYDVDPHVPLILGRPLLRTARALIGHKARDCWSKVVATGANAQPVVTCYGCGEKGHIKTNCPARNNPRRNEARGQAYALRDGDQNLGLNVVTGYVRT